jgi:hypothetical protein
MLGFLTTESHTPIVHVNTLFGDSWALIANVDAAALAAMTALDRSDVRQQTAQRLNTSFVLDFAPYFDSTSEDRAGVPEWASKRAIMEPVADLPPWVAAWNRVLRKLVRRALNIEVAGAAACIILPRPGFLALTGHGDTVSHAPLGGHACSRPLGNVTSWTSRLHVGFVPGSRHAV